MSILQYNGGAVLAMKGKNCVAIGSDKRLGSNQLKTVDMNFEKAFPITRKTMLACTGLASDVQTMARTLTFHKNLFHLREEREMKPTTVAAFVSNMLYQRRFSPWFVEPIVAGLDEEDRPHISGFDLLGTIGDHEDFVCSGTSSDQLVGCCEALWRPDMEADDLFETAAQCLMAGVDRDCLAGWGGVIHVITPKEVITRHLEMRMD